jgi:nitronate monooxygenase
MSAVAPSVEYDKLLTTLLEAERAGAKLLAAYLEELQENAPIREMLARIQRDEAKNCAVLIHLLLEEGLDVSTAVGAFYRRGLGITEWNERLRFLNRGQQWVADRLAAVLPRLPDSNARRLLEAMYQSHVENIALCQIQMPSS